MDEKGGGTTELLMVMTLLIFFGISMYMIIFSGSSAMRRIDEEKDELVEARTALAYINVRLRQFDTENSVSISGDYNGGSAILLKNRDPGDPGLDYDTWIYWDKGGLWEVLADAGMPPIWNAANKIAQIGGLRAAQEDGYLTSTVIYSYNGEQRSISSSILLRSLQEPGNAL